MSGPDRHSISAGVSKALFIVCDTMKNTFRFGSGLSGDCAPLHLIRRLPAIGRSLPTLHSRRCNFGYRLLEPDRAFCSAGSGRRTTGPAMLLVCIPMTRFSRIKQRLRGPAVDSQRGDKFEVPCNQTIRGNETGQEG